MPFVLDASVTLTWFMQDESHPLADLAFAKIHQDFAVVPAIWWYEVQNMLVVNGRRGRIAVVDADQALADLSRMRIRIEAIRNHASLSGIARQFQITV